MPSYVIGGRTIKTDQPLSDAQIEEIAADIGVAATPAPTLAAMAEAPSYGFKRSYKRWSAIVRKGFAETSC
jgi:hypothetical protein